MPPSDIVGKGATDEKPGNVVLVAAHPIPWPLPPRIGDDGTREAPLFQEQGKTNADATESHADLATGSDLESEAPPNRLLSTRKTTDIAELSKRAQSPSGTASDSEPTLARRYSESRQGGKTDDPNGVFRAPKPYVIQREGSNVSCAIFERVAQLYPDSPNQRALTNARAAITDEEPSVSEQDEDETKIPDSTKDQINNNAQVTMPGKQTGDGGVEKTGTLSDKKQNAPPSQHPAPLKMVDEQGSAKVDPAPQKKDDEESAVTVDLTTPRLEDKFVQGVADMSAEDDEYELEEARKERHGLNLGDTNSSLQNPGLRLQSLARTGSGTRGDAQVDNSVTRQPKAGGSFDRQDVAMKDSSARSPGPAIVLRRPIGSRRPSFVCISESMGSSSSFDDDAFSVTNVDSPDAGQGGPDSESRAPSMGRNLRGEEGNLRDKRSARTSSGAKNMPAPYEVKRHGDSPSSSSTGSSGKSDGTRSNEEDARKATEFTSSATATNADTRVSPLGCPLHDEESKGTAPQKITKTLRRRMPGPDTPEAARTEFSVAYPLAKAMDVISEISRVDLGKAVFRRREGQKLRVESKPNSNDDHLVASVEMRAVMEDLTHVKVRVSKSDKGRTAFATLWTFYDDLVTQLEVLAHNAATADRRSERPCEFS